MEEENKKVKKPRNKKNIIRILAVLFVLMTAVCAVLGYNLIKISRLNMYSKNISLNENYFLKDYNEDDTSSAELPQDVFPTSVQGEVNIDSDYIAKVYDTVNRLEISGFISKEEKKKAVAMIVNNDFIGAENYIASVTNYSFYIMNPGTKTLIVPYISQEGILPNGCEAVSATMLLNYYGLNISAVDFVDKYLDKGDVYVKWGWRYGPDPKEKYAGDPKSEKGGWGCFAPVIIKALTKYLPDEYYAKNLTGQSLDKIVSEYIENDIPVALWVTQGMEEIDEVYQWRSYDKSETYLYPVHEHCMVLTGYDSEYYYFNDPYNSNGSVKYEKTKVSYCYNSMGRQAVAVIKSNNSSDYAGMAVLNVNSDSTTWTSKKTADSEEISLFTEIIKESEKCKKVQTSAESDAASSGYDIKVTVETKDFSRSCYIDSKNKTVSIMNSDANESSTYSVSDEIINKFKEVYSNSKAEETPFDWSF